MKNRRQIDGYFVDFILLMNTITFEVCGGSHNIFYYLVYKPLTFILKENVGNISLIPLYGDVERNNCVSPLMCPETLKTLVFYLSGGW